MNKRIALLSILLLLIPVGFLGLISNEAGSQWLLRQIFSVVPNQLAVTKIEGRLLDHFSLSDLHYQSATETISIEKLAITWQPRQLVLGRLQFVDLAIDGLNISLADTPKSQQPSDFELNLPVLVSIENALATDLSYQDGEFVQHLEKLQFAVATADDQLKIVSLTIDDPIIQASAQGQIALSKDLNFNATANWQMHTEQNGVWQGVTTVNGNRNVLSFNQQLSSPFQLALQGNLDDLKTSPRLAAHTDWHNLVWPITNPTPQVKSDQGSIELSGLLSDYQINLNGQLSQHYLPDASLTFTGKGHQTAMTIEKLALSSTTGSFLLSGEVGWQDVVQFDLTASGQNFNPAILDPDMTGNLTFNTHIKGKQTDSSLQLEAEIANLTGQLRGTQVNAHGKLALNEDQLSVDRFEVSAGTNRITANGSIGDVQSELQLAINAPALNQIYPTLAGSLKGAGMLKGTLQNPGINLQLQGKRLRFADYTADQLSIDVDYSQNPQHNSKLLFSANIIKTDSLQIDRAQIEGRGSSANQQFKADIQSSHGNISAEWMGHLQAGNWQGDISKLDLFSPDAGLWQLKRPSILTVTQNPQGIDTAWSETCLLQKNASLCSQGRYQANGDFNASLLASSLPTKLLNPFLPANMSVIGIMNADAELNQQQDLLKGRFQLAIPEAKLSLKNKTTALGASSLAGVINVDSLTTTLDIALADQDYIRGQLQSSIGKSQALNGQLKASIRELAMIELVVPKLSAVQGLLTADLQVKGTRAKPILMGQLNLNQGSVNLVEQGFGLRDMSVNVLASGDQLNSIELNGSLLPKLLNTANASETIELNGLVNVHANLQQHKGLLAGNYRIDSPPLSISLGSAESATKIPVAASAVSGAINGENVSADIDLKLAGQDSIRGQFNLDHTQL